MASTYCTCQGMRGERTARGGNRGCRASVQSYYGSIVVENEITKDKTLLVDIKLSDYSSTCGDYRVFSGVFSGSFEELKKLFEVARQIERGELKVVKVRKKS